jgi:hypothetical protein
MLHRFAEHSSWWDRAATREGLWSFAEAVERRLLRRPQAATDDLYDAETFTLVCGALLRMLLRSRHVIHLSNRQCREAFLAVLCAFVDRPPHWTNGAIRESCGRFFLSRLYTSSYLEQHGASILCGILHACGLMNVLRASATLPGDQIACTHTQLEPLGEDRLHENDDCEVVDESTTSINTDISDDCGSSPDAEPSRSGSVDACRRGVETPFVISLLNDQKGSATTAWSNRSTATREVNNTVKATSLAVERLFGLSRACAWDECEAERTTAAPSGFSAIVEALLDRCERVATLSRYEDDQHLAVAGILLVAMTLPLTIRAIHRQDRENAPLCELGERSGLSDAPEAQLRHWEEKVDHYLCRTSEKAKELSCLPSGTHERSSNGRIIALTARVVDALHKVMPEVL